MKREDLQLDMSKTAVELIYGFERFLAEMIEHDQELLSISIRMPKFKGAEYLLIARLRHKDGLFVAFRSADTMAEVLGGFVRAARLKNLTLKVDKYGDDTD